MQSKYEWLISLADDLADLEEIWYLVASDSELAFSEKYVVVDMLVDRLDQLKGR